MIKHFLTGLTLLTAIHLNVAGGNNIRFHNEATDTLRINEILTDAAKATADMSPETRIAYIGKKFLGTPYAGGTLESADGEKLTVNLDELDCTTYVETVLALAYTVGEGRSSWRDYIYNLERLRYRSGTLNGYGSRLHYVSDWIVDNVHRGNIKEITSNLAGADYEVKSLDFISRNRDKYPALTDSLNYDRIRSMELGYRNHRYPIIKSAKLANKEIARQLQEGDVVMFTSKTPGLDVQHMGIIVLENSVPYVMHASSLGGKVEISKLPLSEYVRRNRSLSGIRVVRLVE